jgi:hypothetical protein
VTRRRCLIACVAPLTAVAALLISVAEDRRYTASAQVLLPASGGTRLLTDGFRPRPDHGTIARRAARSLPEDVTPGRIARDTVVEGMRASVVVKATNPDAGVAARVANAFAREYALTQMDLSYNAILRSGQGSGSAGRVARNLISNSSFERGRGGWVRVQSPNPNWGVTTRWAARGRSSLRASSTGARTGAATPDGISGFPVEAGVPYRLSARVRVRRLERPRDAYMRIRWSSGSGQLVAYSPRLYLRRTGVSLVRYRQPPRSPRGTAYARIELIAEPARGRAFDADLDDVRLERAGPSRPAGIFAANTARRAAVVLRGSPLIERARVPQTASYPRPLSATLIAGLAGLFIALAAAALTRGSSRAS